MDMKLLENDKNLKEKKNGKLRMRLTEFMVTFEESALSLSHDKGGGNLVMVTSGSAQEAIWRRIQLGDQS